MTTVLENDAGDVLNVGRRSRALNPQFPGAPHPEDAVRQFDEECRRQGIDIDASTAECQWQGEAMDDSMFIDSCMISRRNSDSLR